MSPKYICVTGPDGAGKTTQITRLAERLARQADLRVAPITIWDLLIDPESRSRCGFKDPGQVDSYLEILHPTARSMFLFHCFYQAMEQAEKRDPQVCLINSYWYKYYATEVAHGGDPETIRRLAAVFPEPDITFHLSIDPESAFERKARLSAYETGFAEPRSKEAFVAFQQRAQAAMQELSEGLDWVELNGSESATQLTDLILERIGLEQD